MSDAGATETGSLERMARDVAEEVAGPGVFADVAVEPAVDSLDRATHLFTFLVTPEAAARPLGEARLRLGMGLRDRLLARGRETPPLIRVLDREDWARFRRA